MKHDPSDAALKCNIRVMLVNCAYGASPSRHGPPTEARMDDAHTQPRTLNLPDRIELARALQRHGLGHVRLPGLTIDGPPCLGLAHGCMCPDCTAQPVQAPDDVAQPWTPRPARHAA